MQSSGIHALVAAAAALALGSAAHPHDGRAPAAGCDASGTLSAVICADPDLAARERAIAVLLPAARTAVLAHGPSAEDAAQRRFMDERDACAVEADVRACLRNVYDYRAYDLAVAALLADHRAAMPEIERHSSKAAEIYEAIYQYATIADRPARTSAVARTITPAFETLKRSGPGSILGHIPDAATAASSDEDFSTFLGAASADGYRGGAGPLTLPCAALVRRPGLLAAMANASAVRSTVGSRNRTAPTCCPPCPHSTDWSPPRRARNRSASARSGSRSDRTTGSCSPQCDCIRWSRRGVPSIPAPPRLRRASSPAKVG